MAIRRPAVAGTFYPADHKSLKTSVENWLAQGLKDASPPSQSRGNQGPFALMLPHAGYIYCGRVIGATLANITLPQHFIILCPNHTGQGHPLGVWPNGAWLTPFGPVTVDPILTDALLQGVYEPDTHCHQREHSIEVLLPFLQILTQNQAKIAAVCVGTRDSKTLRTAGLDLAAALEALRKKNFPDICILVSSDMNHYNDEQTTLKKDNLALEKALACDPDGLLAVVAEHHITMCGASPLAIALYAAQTLGSPSARLTLHDTSSSVSGDSNRAVGYAGLHITL